MCFKADFLLFCYFDCSFLPKNAYLCAAYLNNIMRKLFAIIVALLPVWACGQSLDMMVLEARMAAEGEWMDEEWQHEASYMKGQYLNLRIDGALDDEERVKFSFRQRLNRLPDASFLNATDWMYIDWKVSDRWNLAGGKQVVYIGGYEYDRAPIDLYYCSDFWNRFPDCYAFGASVSYNFNTQQPTATPQQPTTNTLLFQICNSPFSRICERDLMAYNLEWFGHNGAWETMWSVNLIEQGHRTEQKMLYVALGNRFGLSDRVRLDLDVMSRSALNRVTMRDVSVMTELEVKATEAWTLYGKYTWDVNDEASSPDMIVVSRTNCNMASAGAMFRPLTKNRDALMLFAMAAYTHSTLPTNHLQLQLGMKVKFDALTAIKKLKI